MNKYPEILHKISNSVSEAYRNSDLEITTEFESPKENSREDGDLVAEYLRREFPGKVTVSRSPTDWTDISVMVGDRFYPLNIKSTNAFRNGCADNVCRSAALLYPFTNVSEEEIRNDSFTHEEVKYLLETRKCDLNRDYYFLVINKSHPTDVVLNSLKYLIPKRTNSEENLPFQVKWSVNRTPMFASSFEESYKRLHYVFYSSSFFDKIPNGLLEF